MITIISNCGVEFFQMRNLLDFKNNKVYKATAALPFNKLNYFTTHY